jgi:hypothetical protein
VSIYNKKKTNWNVWLYSIDGNEITQLQERLASTESQMCKILTALDAASDKVNQMTKKSEKVEIQSLNIFLSRFSIIKF